MWEWRDELNEWMYKKKSRLGKILGNGFTRHPTYACNGWSQCLTILKMLIVLRVDILMWSTPMVWCEGSLRQTKNPKVTPISLGTRLNCDTHGSPKGYQLDGLAFLPSVQSYRFHHPYFTFRSLVTVIVCAYGLSNHTHTIQYNMIESSIYKQSIKMHR